MDSILTDGGCVYYCLHIMHAGAPAAGGGRGNRTMDSLVPPESDALFRATVEALLLGELVDHGRSALLVCLSDDASPYTPPNPRPPRPTPIPSKTATEDKDKSEDGPPQNNNRTYHVVLRGGSISAGGDMVAVGGREPLHQEQVIVLMVEIVCGAPKGVWAVMTRIPPAISSPSIMHDSHRLSPS